MRRSIPKAESDVRAVVVSGEGGAFCAGLDLSNFAEDKEPMDLMPRTHGLANVPQQVAQGWRTAHARYRGRSRCRTGGWPQHHVRRGHSHYPSGDALRRDGDALGIGARYGGLSAVAGQCLVTICSVSWFIPTLNSPVLRPVSSGLLPRLPKIPSSVQWRWREEIAGKNPEAIRAAKRLSNALADCTDEDLLLTESEEQTQIIGKANQMEAVMSFMEGRAPNFS